MTAGDLASCMNVGGHRPPLQFGMSKSASVYAKPSGREELVRNIGIGFCVLQLFISGCISAAVTRNRSVSPVSRSATVPLPFSDYMRTVYRISEEGALEPEDRRQKVLQSHPELSKLATCVASDAANIDCRIELAEAYVHEGLLWSAYGLFNEALNINAEDFRSTLGLARIWDQWKDYSMAIRVAVTAIAINPRSAEAHELMGDIQLHDNKPAAAVAEFKQSLELAAGDAVVTANLGYAQMLLRNWSQAKASFERALSLDASLAETRNNLGIVLAQMGDYDAAFAQMQQVSGPAVAYNNLGVVLLIFRNEPVAAVRAFERALRYAPDYEKARANLETARASLPASVVVHLPKRQGVRPVAVALEQTAAPASEWVIQGQAAAVVRRADPPHIQDHKRPAISDAARGPVVPFRATQSSVAPSPQPRRLVRSLPRVSLPNITGEHITIYAALAFFGMIVVTSITSRCILSRMAVSHRSL